MDHRRPAADSAPPDAPAPRARSAHRRRARVLLERPEREIVRGIDLAAAVVAPAVPSTPFLVVGPLTVLEDDGGADRVRRIGTGSERVPRVDEVAELELREPDEYVVAGVNRERPERVRMAAVPGVRRPVLDPPALDEVAASVDLDPLDASVEHVAGEASDRHSKRLRVVDVTVAEDGVADPRVARVDSRADLLRQDVPRPGRRPDAERVHLGCAADECQRLAVERPQPVRPGRALDVLDHVQRLLGRRIRDRGLKREAARDADVDRIACSAGPQRLVVERDHPAANVRELPRREHVDPDRDAAPAEADGRIVRPCRLSRIGVGSRTGASCPAGRPCPRSRSRSSRSRAADRRRQRHEPAVAVGVVEHVRIERIPGAAALQKEVIDTLLRSAPSDFRSNHVVAVQRRHQLVASDCTARVGRGFRLRQSELRPAGLAEETRRG